MLRFIFSLFLLAVFLETAAAVPLINYNDSWRYRKGTSAPQANWKTAADASLDPSWLTGPGWIGYGDGSGANAAGTTLADMRQTTTPANPGYRTFYIRKTFTVPAGTPATDEVVLDTDFDDAFIVWINGSFVDSQGSPASPAEPAFNTTATVADHECSFGNGAQSPVRRTVIGTVGTNFPPGTYVLAAMCINDTITSSDAVLKMTLFTRTVQPPLPLHWTLAISPIELTSTFNVAAGEELIIDPGVEVRCHAGSDAINCAGKITANGTAAARIRFIPAAAGVGWERIRMSGTPESVFKYCDFDGSSTSGTIRGAGTSSVATSVTLENCRFLNTDVQMVDLTYSSCNLINCEFDSIGPEELVHFSNMPANGHALIKGCIFGIPGVPPTSGYNDIVDLTGGNRPGPIARFIDNIFLASGEDCFDMDATDAHIEGNIFLNVLQSAQRDSSSNPITTGEGPAVAELVICRNYFYNCEHLLLLKDSGAAVLQNNSFLRMVTNPNARDDNGNPIPPGIILFGEPWRGRPLGAGAIYEGNIAWDLAPVIQATPFPLYASASSFLRVNRSLIQGNQWPGTGNITQDPRFVSTTGINHTNIRNALTLLAGSPAISSGPNGLDMGAAVPAGASVGGAPAGITASRDATLQVGGPGIWVYRWRLDGGAWSADVPLVPASVLNGGVFTATMYDNPTPIVLTDLPDGTHTVDVIGQNSAGDWQETPVTRTWIVSSDTDTDGMPDAWESGNRLNSADPGDAPLDADSDGQTNRQEYIAGTDPHDSTSRLTAAAIASSPGQYAVTFNAIAGKSYTVRYKDDLTSPTWLVLRHFGSQSISRPLTVLDTPPAGITNRFYQVITPQQP